MLGQLPPITDPHVLVGSSNADDAGVYRLTDEIAVVLTADFFTPIVDDPYWFGAISAANSLSDIYAMGARPVTALNIAMFPSQPEFFVPGEKRDSLIARLEGEGLLAAYIGDVLDDSGREGTRIFVER